MRDFSEKKKRQGKFRQAIVQHLIANYRDYFMILLFFLVGIVLGVVFINKIDRHTAKRNYQLHYQFYTNY